MSTESELETSTRQQGRMLGVLLESDAVLESACRPYGDHLLLDYITAELNGHAAAALFPDVCAHLQQSPECWQEYVEIKQLLLLERTGQFVEPAAAGVFDFSFLTAAVAQEKESKPLSAASAWRLDAVGHLIVEFSAELLRMLQQFPSQPAYAFERAEEGAQIRYQLTLQEGLDDLQVTVTVRDTPAKPDQYMLVVETDIPSRGGWPHLGDTEVTLKGGNETLAQQYTDAFGRAAFSSVPAGDLAHLIIEIAPVRD